MNKYTTGARPSYRENGSRYPEDITGKDRSRLKRAMHVLVANHYNFNRNGLSAKRVRVLYDIKAWAQRRNVTLIVWINPFPQEVLDLFANSDVGRLFAEFKQMVKSIFPDVIDLSAVLPDDKYYQDDFYHYTSDTAELIYRNYLLPRLKLIEPTTSVVAPL